VVVIVFVYSLAERKILKYIATGKVASGKQDLTGGAKVQDDFLSIW